MTKSVLLVEDDDLFAMLLTMQIEDLGLTVERAIDGEEALEKRKTATFDAIITDLFMSRMDGLKFLEIIKPATLDIPVIVITGSNTDEVKTALKELGIQHVLFKPFEEKDFDEISTILTGN